MEHRESCDQEQKPPAGLVHASLMLAVLLDVFGANPSGMYLSLGNYGGVLASEAACAIVICLPLWRYYVRYGRRGLAAAGTSVAGIGLIVGLHFVLIAGSLVAMLWGSR